MFLQKKKLEDLTPKEKTIVFTTAAVEVGLAVYATQDLIRAKSDALRGPKFLWGSVIPISFVGPLAYLIIGKIKK